MPNVNALLGPYVIVVVKCPYNAHLEIGPTGSLISGHF